jgi:hypothetical protein
MLASPEYAANRAHTETLVAMHGRYVHYIAYVPASIDGTLAIVRIGSPAEAEYWRRLESQQEVIKTSPYRNMFRLHRNGVVTRAFISGDDAMDALAQKAVAAQYDNERQGFIERDEPIPISKMGRDVLGNYLTT